jgi:hypothetical protein
MKEIYGMTQNKLIQSDTGRTWQETETKDCEIKEEIEDSSSTDSHETETMLHVEEKWTMNWKGHGRIQ